MTLKQKIPTFNRMLHIPVLLKEVIENFRPCFEGKDAVLIDGTFGRGGHSKALLKEFPNLKILAFDQDHEAVNYGLVNFKNEVEQRRLTINHLNFEAVPDLGHKVDGVLLDLGVSSPQLDEPERGFSFYHNGPLDMRMDQSNKKTAADIINDLDEDELIGIFKTFGEIQKPYRVVRAVLHDRKENPFTQTKQLSGLIERVEGWKRKGFHPATQYFMALRLAVNNELGILQEVVPKFFTCLNQKGRMSIITFHSLEDRIVKTIFRNSQEQGHPVNKKVIHPTRDEEVSNPRSRSAKLRVFEKETSV